MDHFQVEITSLLLELRVILLLFKLLKSVLGHFVIFLNLKDLVIGNLSLFGLVASLIKNTEVVPVFRHVWLKSGSLDNVIKSFSVISVLEIVDSNCRPVNTLSRHDLSSFLEAVKGLVWLLKHHIASTINIQSIGMILLFQVSVLQMLNSKIEVALLEAHPSQMLVDLEIVFILRKCSFI